jgi:hypothetical protein
MGDKTQNLFDMPTIITKRRGRKTKRKNVLAALVACLTATIMLAQAQLLVKAAPDIPGDINGDGVVDVFDVVIIAVAYGTEPGDPNWNPQADLNIDNIIDIGDLVIWADHFGETEI